MKPSSFILNLVPLFGLLLTASAHGADFWLFGRMPSPEDAVTGIRQFKFAYLHPWDDSTFWSNDGSSQNGSEPKAALPVRVVEGRFLVKLPLKSSSEAENEFLVRVWVSNGSSAATLLIPDWRLVRADVPSGKNRPAPVEIMTRGPVFSSSAQKSDPVILASSHPSSVALKWKAAAGGFEYDVSEAVAISPDVSNKVLLSSHLYCERGKVSHSGIRLPFQALRKGGLTPDMLGKNLQSDTSYNTKPATPDQYGLSRQWEDNNGRKLTATFCDSDGTIVILRGADGNLMLLDLKTMSPAHHAYVNSLRGP